MELVIVRFADCHLTRLLPTVFVVSRILVVVVIPLALSEQQVGLLFFLIVLGLSKLSAKPHEGKVQFDDKNASTTSANPSTPKKKRSGMESPKGTMMTPGGRRSARLAKTPRKEE